MWIKRSISCLFYLLFSLSGYAQSVPTDRAQELILAGDLVAARAYLRTYVAGRFEAGERTRELAEAYQQLGGLNFRSSDLTLALGQLDTCGQILAEQAESPLLLARMEWTRARIYDVFPLYDEGYRSVDRAQQALESATELGEVVPINLLVGILATKAAIAANLQDENEALLLIGKARSYPAESLNVDVERELQYAQMVTFTLFGMHDEAIELGETYIRKFRKEGDVSGEAIALANVAVNQSNAGYYERAEATFREANRLTRKSLSGPLARKMHGNMASLYNNWMEHDLRVGRFDRIDSFLTGAHDYSEVIMGRRGGLHIAGMYATAAVELDEDGQTERADSLMELAIRAVAMGAPRYGPARLPVLTPSLRVNHRYFHILVKLQAMALRRNTPGALTEALAIGRQVDTIVSAIEGRLSLRQSLGSFQSLTAESANELLEIALLQFRRTGEMAYLDRAYSKVAGRKGRLLQGYLSSPFLAEQFGVPVSVLERQRELKLRLNSLERQLEHSSEPGGELADSLVVLSGRIFRLQDSVAARYPAYFRAGIQRLPDDWRAARVSDRPVVLEYHLTKDSVYCFRIVNGTELSFTVRPFPAKLRSRAREVLSDAAVSAMMYATLVAPNLEGIAPGTPLTIIPDGNLWRLPFTALRSAENKFLIQDHPVTFAYSWSSLGRKGPETDSELPYLGFGMDYIGPGAAPVAELRELSGSEIGALFNTVSEIDAARGFFFGQDFKNETATKRNLLEFAGRTEVLHLALHGSRHPNPFRSGLLLSGGQPGQYDVLTMGEVLRNRYPTELTILSACHSGNGPLETNDGPQSIARAFAFSGSRAVLASNWEANDEVTFRIVTGFCGYLAEGMTKDLAYQRAVLDFLEGASPPERDPRRWANLTLAGSITALPASHRISYWWWAALAVSAVAGWLLIIKKRPPETGDR